ncbi:nucleoside recognition domain-containing protein [Cohnella silvisoli]|uniref:Sporulation integral membrane protein YlbJ n=1 Tax=Cohnella silvisoli TaxID=2873699 RepID=A0ABV1KWL0_9BACL|nr:nucleoside recognition domain-containing protein [Cohnella silvisoli]MCD9023909.1 sporulation integral membrane protein YlbJ [Cohnella silvisoli]
MRKEQENKEQSSRWYTLASVFTLGGISLFIGCLAIISPQVAMEASLRGVSVWWEVLFPALFPFFVLSELLLGFGIVHLAGTLLDPFMRPLFRLPGVGGFVVAMGFASGYPVGARLTSRLMEQKLVTRNQGERLVAMTTTSDPIFLIGAVCIGFFGSLEAAPALAVAHYGGALLLGVFSHFRKQGHSSFLETVHPIKGSRIGAALSAMHRARLADGRPFGILLQQSLQSSLTLMMIVGGLVVFFSAALELLVHSGFLMFFRDLTARLLHEFGLYPGLASSFVKGTFEVTLGAKSSAADTAIPLVDRAAAAAFVLSWGGLSVHAQVAGLMSRTDWRYIPFARARFIHGLLAMLLVYLVWPLFMQKETMSLPVWAQAIPPFHRTLIPTVAWLPLVVLTVIAVIVAAGALALGIAKMRRGREV